ncbi:hypothetical protein QJS04_geneDACA018789 [Acorus gramineus]|uniref:KNOX2 domain-containing protein n=1 Tax=Acorus gramineus TaxID=55184 RepID=A0AAV9BR47_ACOGR|nr:hypothetical protein QJS04_geneDACA018789 [Acorus gramineus]
MEGDGEASKAVEEGEVEEEQQILKRRILCHPLFELLKEAHLDCLKASLNEGDVAAEELQMESRPSTVMGSHPDLDLFMEVYSSALLELKHTIRGPMEEAMSFIERMHVQLAEMAPSPSTSTTTHSPGTPSEIMEGEDMLLGCESMEEEINERLTYLNIKSEKNLQQNSQNEWRS